MALTIIDFRKKNFIKSYINKDFYTKIDVYLKNDNYINNGLILRQSYNKEIDETKIVFMSEVKINNGLIREI